MADESQMAVKAQEGHDTVNNITGRRIINILRCFKVARISITKLCTPDFEPNPAFAAKVAPRPINGMCLVI